MEITLGPLRVMHDVVIVDIQAAAILGIDFLLEHECKLDIPAQQLCQHEGYDSPSRLPEQLEVLLEKCAENLTAN